MPRLHRHQLVRLGDAGWRGVLSRGWDAEALDCLAHWATHRLPLVVTRQPATLPDDRLALGLAAPARWTRRRLAIEVARADVVGLDDFPPADAVIDQIAPPAHAAWRALCASLASAGVEARVYGSHGWQFVTGMPCVHPESDVDLWLAVDDASRVDGVIAALQRFASNGRPRIDGELVFADGRAYAWREWQAWREGRCSRLLAKALAGAALVCAPASAPLSAGAGAAP